MKAYPEYKDSGIEWLGEVPSHWKRLPLKYCVELVLGKMLQSTKPNLDGYTLEKYLKSRNVAVLSLADMENLDEMWFSDYEKEMYRLNDGDIVMNEGGDIGKVAKWVPQTFDCYIQNSVHKLTPKHNVDPTFLTYYLSNVGFSGYFHSIVNQISIAHLTKEKLAVTPVALPSLSEQKSIAAYLDERVGKIDALMEQKRGQVEEIRAYRTSLITEAVTRGLNPDVPLRPSGVDWIGDIPKHWECLKFKYLLKDQLKYGANESGVDYEDSLPRYVRITDIQNERLRDDIKLLSLPEDVAKDYILDHNDILFARSGATVGKTFLYKETYGRCAFAGYLIKASINEQNYPDFVYYYTKSAAYETWKNQSFNQATIQNIGADKYSVLPVPVPPLSEQQAIANYLDEKTEKIDALIGELNAQLDELAEYKKSVISEAVTGKVDVRDYPLKNDD